MKTTLEDLPDGVLQLVGVSAGAWLANRSVVTLASVCRRTQALLHAPQTMCAMMVGAKGAVDALGRAATAGRLTECRIVLATHPESIDVAGNVPLRRAVTCNQREACELLLSNGAPPDEWALWAAADRGHTDVCRLLLDRGAPVDGHANMALRMAVDGRQLETCLLLLQRGASLDAVTDLDFRRTLQLHTRI